MTPDDEGELKGPDEDTAEATLRALKDFQRHSMEDVEAGVEGEADAVLSWTEVQPVRMPSIFYKPTHDRVEAFQKAMCERPNVYVRRARRALGLPPTGMVYRHEALRLPDGCQCALLRVGRLASPEPEPIRRQLSQLEKWLLLGVGLMGAFCAYGLLGGRSK